jgi:hypothetical protein
VVEMLDAWAAVAPVDSLVTELLEALLSPKCTADGKAEGIAWLASLVGAHTPQGPGWDVPPDGCPVDAAALLSPKRF